MIDQLTNRYKVLSTLGEGGMGVVFLVEDTTTGRQVALKVLSKVSGDPTEAHLRFKQEFRTMTRLRHPNTVEVYDYGQLSDGTPFFTMEVVPGHGLDERLPLPAEDCRSVALQLVRALGYIHRQGLVHCDIKPENIRVTPDGVVKLMDFGLMVDAGTAGGTIRGTIAYMAPEVARRGKIDARADLYGFGALAFHLLAGLPPFPGEDPVSVLRAHLEADPPALRTLVPDTPADLEDIVARLLEKDPRARFQSAAELLGALGDTTAEEGEAMLLGSPLVGREKEQGELTGLLARLKEGRGGQLWLVGDLGIGKTRLLEEFRFQVQLAEMPILAGRATEGMAPYGPFLDVLRGLIPMVPGEVVDRHRGLLARLLPELDDGGPRLDLEPNQEQHRMRAAFGELVGEACSRGLVLALDDWHLADEMSRKLLSYLLRNLADRPLLVVAATRTLEADNEERTLAIPPLQDSAVAEMVKAMLGGSEVAGDFLESFARLTGGSPLYVESSLRHLRENGIIVSEGGRWIANTTLTAKHLPGSIKDLLREQVHRLTADALRIARAGALLGRPGSLQLLSRATGLSEEPLFEAIEDLRAAGVMVNEEGRVSFVQNQLAEVIRDEIPDDAALELHTQLAYGIEDQGVEGLQGKNELARHFLRSRDSRKAAAAALVAGLANLQLYALGEATEFLQAGLPLVPEDDRVAGMHYHHGLATLARYRSNLEEAATRYKAALALAEELGDAEIRANALTSLGIVHQIRNEFDTALETLQSAEAVARETGNERERLRALRTMARVYYKKADPLKAIEYSEQALQVAGEARGRVDGSGPMAFLGLMYVSADVPGLDATTRTRRGVEYLESAAMLQREIGDKVGLNDSLNLLGNARGQILGEYQAARQIFEENLSIAIEIGAKNDEIVAYLNLAIQSHELGDFKEVENQAAKAHRESVATKSQDFELIAEVLRSVALAYLGHPAEAERMHDHVLGVLHELPPDVRTGIEITVLPYFAERQLFMGQVLRALASAQEAMRITLETGMLEYEQRILTLLGEAYARLGEFESAAQQFELGLEKGRTVGAPGTIARANAGLGHLALKRGELESAARLVEEAHASASNIGAAYLAAETAFLRGRIALVGADRAVAASAFDEVLRRGKEIGCPHLEALGEFGLARLGNRSDDAYKHLRAAQALLAGQLKGLSDEDIQDFYSPDERWRIQKGDLSPEELPGVEGETEGAGSRLRYQQLERKYLELLEEGRRFRSELDETGAARERLERLLKFTVETNRETDLSRLLEGIMNLVGSMVGADRGFLLLKEADGLVPKSTYNIDPRDRRPTTWKFSESVAEKVYQSGEPVFIDDVLEAEGYQNAQSIVDLNVRTVLCVPLRAVSRGEAGQASQDRTIGVIYLDRQSVSNAFLRRDLVLVEALAAQACQAIENARLHTDSEDQRSKLEKLNALIREVSTTLDLPKVLDMVIRRTLEHTRAERAFIFLKDHNGLLTCRLAMDNGFLDITSDQAQVSTSITRQVLETGEAVCLLDTQNSDVFQAQKSILDLELRTVMCVAFRMPRAKQGTKKREDKRQKPDVEFREPREEYHGVLYVDSKVVVNAFNERDLQLLESIASHASLAIYNAQLYERATVDALTGLYFRSFFERRLIEEAGRSARIGSPLSVLLSDIDHFKRFNDTYGHSTGDDVLRLVAQTIRRNIREDDMAARFGGEEMLVLMPDTPLEGALVLAERLREAVASAALVGPNGDPLSVTISIGVAQMGPDESPHDVVEHADQAMYVSKKGGRNRVTTYTVPEASNAETGTPEGAQA
ncbi:MAG: diguanylate cyclase [Candidatus Sericytochromatia bacterium]|nr:diguanylate cyclase [Candidatus Tanganyikabacteria bacterium]